MRIIDPREQHAGRVCPECGQERPRTTPPAEPLRGAKIAHEPAPKPECGFIMPHRGEPCARRPGHRDSHRSRWVMDDEARRRRGRGYVAA